MADKYQGSLIFSARFAICIGLAFGSACVYSIRVNLSIAIVAMMDNSSNPDFPSFDWDEKTKSLILSSFFWGYTLTPVLGGMLAHRFGGKLMLLLGVGLSALATLLTPFAANMGGWMAVCALRTVEGLVQACIYPSMHTLLSKWSPPHERGILATTAYLNSQMGTVLTLAVSGEIAASSWGWPGIFYLAGGLGLVWSVAFYFLAADSPATSRFISEAERNYIESSLASKQMQEKSEKEKCLKTPWKSIGTSWPFLILAICHACFNMGYWTLMTEIPSYLKHVLGMDVKKNGLLSSVPYLTMYLMGILFALIATLINKRKWMSIEFSRKFFNSIAFWLPAITLVCLGYCTKETTVLAIVLLSLSVGFSGAVSFGFQINHMDLAPNFAGTLLGITQCPAHLVAIIAPILAGYIITDETNPQQWRIVFFISSFLFFLGNALFICYGSVETQSWNEPQNEFYKSVPLEDILSDKSKPLQIQLPEEEKLQNATNDRDKEHE